MNMDQDDDVPAAWAGTSHGVESAGAASHEDEGNPVAKLQSQILELGRRHDQVMSTLANMSNVATRSYVYIPRDHQIVPFSGDYVKDGRRVHWWGWTGNSGKGFEHWWLSWFHTFPFKRFSPRQSQTAYGGRDKTTQWSVFILVWGL